MPRRFTDTEKWDDPWFADLDQECKLLWLYLIDRCSHAGIWKTNFKHMRFHCDSTKSNEDIKELFKERIHEINGEKWFIPKFIKFQYPSGLNSNKPAIVSVRNEVINNGLKSIINKLYSNDYLIIKDKYKDKDIDKGKNKDKDIEARKQKFVTEVIALKNTKQCRSYQELCCILDRINP